jgi:RNA polymerase sigma factor (sigma-70 family)
VNDEDVDDVLQACFLRIWNGLASYDSELGEIGPWMMGCMHHEITDHLRSQQRYLRKTSRYGSNRQQDTLHYLERKNTAENKILERIDRERLTKVVDCVLSNYVTERQESLIRRHFMEHRMWRDIAAEDGITKNAALQAWLYGRERLRRTIQAFIDPSLRMPNRAPGRSAA